jgi:hypothetical protein
MSERIKIKTGVITVKRSDGLFVGHLHDHEIFSNENVLPMIRALREWRSIEQLLQEHADDLPTLTNLISRLEEKNLLEKSCAPSAKQALIISHMNELGTLLSAVLIEKGYDVSTRDTRSSQICNVRGQFIRISDAGESFQEIVASQKREIRNSGNQEHSPITEQSHSQVKSRTLMSKNQSQRHTLVLITAYPEPELLAELMEAGSDYFCAITTPNGGILGPFVRPGVTPCFHCIELAQSCTDGQWQKVAATLFIERFAPLEMANALLTTALLIEKIKYLLEGELPHDNLAETTDLSFSNRQHAPEIGLVAEQSRRWSFHPECSCHWR